MLTFNREIVDVMQSCCCTDRNIEGSEVRVQMPLTSVNMESKQSLPLAFLAK